MFEPMERDLPRGWRATVRAARGDTGAYTICLIIVDASDIERQRAFIRSMADAMIIVDAMYATPPGTWRLVATRA